MGRKTPVLRALIKWEKAQQEPEQWLRAGVRKILMNHLVHIYYSVIILWNKMLKKGYILHPFTSFDPG